MAASWSISHSGSDPTNTDLLSRHLHPQFTGAFESGSEGSSTKAGKQPAAPDEPLPHTVAEEGQQSSLKLQGGDIHRDPYRKENRSKRARLGHRALTYSYERRESESGNGVVENAVAGEPGAFRRQYLHSKKRRFSSTIGANNFVEFLELYGNFAGEDLAESEDESAISTTVPTDEETAEREPLLPRRHKRSRSARPGDASDLKSFFTLLKAFIGTGIMFLPKAFRNGGILFSSITLVTVSIVTTVCFHLLLQCRRQYGGAYGDIGEKISGPHLRSLILTSITISQLGFVCAGIVFIAENLHTFFKAVAADSNKFSSTGALIALQLVVLIPLAFVRNISKLGPMALLADIFILMGLAYIYYYDIATIASRSGLEPTVVLFNPDAFTLTIGSSIFTFEGIGLILPIQSSMKKPEHFDRLLYIVMTLITVLFTAVGALSYGTFGNQTKTEIISNFPQTDKFVNAVQFLYSMAVLVGTPVQLFPAIRIMEGRLFVRGSGKRDPRIKWKKNAFRTAIVILCCLIAAVGAGGLDKFVALTGSFACVPLVYIYPAYLHWRGIATLWWVRAGDILMMVAGIICMIYTTFVTLVH